MIKNLALPPGQWRQNGDKIMKTCVAVYNSNQYSLTRFFHITGSKHFLGEISCHYHGGINVGDGTQYTAYNLPKQGHTPEESRDILRRFAESTEGVHRYGRTERWDFED